MSKLRKFVDIFQLPPAMIPHIDHVVTELEMDLVVALGEDTMTIEQIAETLGMPIEAAVKFVRKAYERNVIKKGPGRGPYAEAPVNQDGPATYSAHVFYRRLDPLSMYESWGDVPAAARKAVIDWQLQEFIDFWGPAVNEMRKDPDAHTGVPNSDFLLLEEALEIVDAAEDHAVLPCDCRTIVRACDRPVETCIRLDQGALTTLAHGHGRRVTKEEMKRIVLDADRAGLMHTGNRFWKRDGQLFGLCNCCACDCYPIRAGIQLGLNQRWPRSHFIAGRDTETCTHCGTCVKRCQFGAFFWGAEKIQINGKIRKPVLFDPDKCWGCGLCATACSQAAVSMVPLARTQGGET